MRNLKRAFDHFVNTSYYMVKTSSSFLFILGDLSICFLNMRQPNYHLFVLIAWRVFRKSILFKVYFIKNS